MTTNFKSLSLTALQFSGNDTNSQMLRRLVTDLVTAEKAINQLVSFANNLPDPTAGVPEHELAGEDGLGPSHTVSGLTIGDVLIAVAKNNAIFRKLRFSDLALSDVSNDPENGQVIQFVDGFWTAVDLDVLGGSSGENLGTGAGWYLDNQGSTLRFKSALNGQGIAFDVTANSISIRLEEISDNTLLGSITGGIPIALTADQVTAMLDLFTTVAQGMVPPPGAIVGNVLSDDGT